jgi:hypothetical protein
MTRISLAVLLKSLPTFAYGDPLTDGLLSVTLQINDGSGNPQPPSNDIVVSDVPVDYIYDWTELSCFFSLRFFSHVIQSALECRVFRRKPDSLAELHGGLLEPSHGIFVF